MREAQNTPPAPPLAQRPAHTRTAAVAGIDVWLAARAEAERERLDAELTPHELTDAMRRLVAGEAA